MKKIKFKSVPWPDPPKGVDYTGCEVLVVPDQSMSLAEILDRFVVGEQLPVGMKVDFGEDSDFDNPLHVDLEKLMHADFVDKSEYVDQLKAIQKTYLDQEKRKSDAHSAKLKEAEREKLRAEIKAEILSAQNPL